MRDTFSGVEFSQSFLDFGQEHQSFDRVIKSGLRWQILEGLQNSITCTLGWHDLILPLRRPLCHARLGLSVSGQRSGSAAAVRRPLQPG